MTRNSATVADCSDNAHYSGAPPLRVCDTTLWSGADGAMLIDAQPHMPPQTSASSGGFLFIRVSPDRAHGAWVIISSADAVVTAVAEANDDLPAAVVIDSIRPNFTIEIREREAPFEMTVALT